MINQVILIGRIVKNLELKLTKNKVPYVRFVLAVNNDYNNTADFIPVIAWTKTAENLVNYQTKGSLIAIAGSLQIRSVEFEQENKIYFSVLANQIHYLEPKNKRVEPKRTVEADKPIKKEVDNTDKKITIDNNDGILWNAK